MCINLPYIRVDKSISQIRQPPEFELFCDKSRNNKEKNLSAFEDFCYRIFRSECQQFLPWCSFFLLNTMISLLASMVSLASHALYVLRLTQPLLNIYQSNSRNYDFRGEKCRVRIHISHLRPT